MKAIICEMCGSNDIIKQDGLYLCQNCGTKYSVEEARRLMVDISGSRIVIDRTNEMSNLLELARRARDENNCENAIRYYDHILLIDASNWEARFYSMYFKAMAAYKGLYIDSVKGNFYYSIDNILRETTNVLLMIKQSFTDINQLSQKVYTITKDIIDLSSEMCNTDNIFKISSMPQSNLDFKHQYINVYLTAKDFLYRFGDLIISMFGDAYGSIASMCWQTGVRRHIQILPRLSNIRQDKKIINEYNDKIKKFSPDYQAPKVSKLSILFS